MCAAVLPPASPRRCRGTGPGASPGSRPAVPGPLAAGRGSSPLAPLPCRRAPAARAPDRGIPGVPVPLVRWRRLRGDIVVYFPDCRIVAVLLADSCRTSRRRTGERYFLLWGIFNRIISKSRNYGTILFSNAFISLCAGPAAGSAGPPGPANVFSPSKRTISHDTCLTLPDSDRYPFHLNHTI